MPAAQYDILCEQGSTFALSMTYEDGNGQPVDLSGYSARMKAKSSAQATDSIVELTTENGRITLGADGSIALSIDAATTAAFPAISAVYDLELVNGSTVTRLLKGKFLIDAEVTR